MNVNMQTGSPGLAHQKQTFLKQVTDGPILRYPIRSSTFTSSPTLDAATFETLGMLWLPFHLVATS